MPEFRIRLMTAEDCETALILWASYEGIGLSGADTRERIAAFLLQNPGLSLAAECDGRIVGTLLCGHDGRRGYIYHLAVAKGHRREGIAGALVRRCLESLRPLGIQKCHAFVYVENTDALRFWESVGWVERTELVVVSRDTALED